MRPERRNMRFFTLIALLTVMFIMPVMANDWHFGVGMEGLTPSTFVIEKDIGKCKLSPAFGLEALASSNSKINLGFDFLYPIEPVYLSLGYEYVKFESTSTSVIPFGIAYYHKFDWFTIKLSAKSELNINDKSLALSTSKLSWFIFF